MTGRRRTAVAVVGAAVAAAAMVMVVAAADSKQPALACCTPLDTSSGADRGTRRTGLDWQTRFQSGSCTVCLTKPNQRRYGLAPSKKGRRCMTMVVVVVEMEMVISLVAGGTCLASAHCMREGMSTEGDRGIHRTVLDW